MGDKKTMELLSMTNVSPSPKTRSSAVKCNSSCTNVTAAATPFVYESYVDNYVGLNVLGKRDIANYSFETKIKIAALAEELFQLKVKRIILLRKESELDYQVHDLILQEEYKQRSNTMMALANRKSSSNHNIDNEEDVDDVIQMKETRLFNQMMDITSRRNQLLIDLDNERLREEEEENEIMEEHKQLQKALQNLRCDPTTTSSEMTADMDHHGQSQDQTITNNNKRGRRKIKLHSCFLC